MFQIRVLYYISLTVISIGLNACGIWKKPPPAPAAPTLVATAASPSATTPKPDATPVETTWVFTVNPEHSKGKVDLSLDPKGSLLGPKPAQDVAPLKGQILVTVITDRSGKRSIRLKDVNLTNTVALAMPFHWSRLVGSISVHIPVHVLKISKHSFHRVCRLNKDGGFSLERNFFTVGGGAKVTGSGLVLSQAVGKRDVDLTIKKTEDVEVNGSLTIKKGIATLRIPSAVMRDRFDMEGSMLDLVFTGDITATAKVR